MIPMIPLFLAPLPRFPGYPGSQSHFILGLTMITACYNYGMSYISVEYAHIYTNQRVNDEHTLSLKLLQAVEADIKANGNERSLVVMVDDYSFPDPSFDYASFVTWLDDQGFKPDLLFRESQLIPLCDEVLSLVSDHELKTQLIDYIKVKKYPCSLFIAAWYLLRLGRIESSLYPHDLQADELLNILPVSFQPFEDKGLEIIRSTPFATSTNAIKYKFLPGRLIA